MRYNELIENTVQSDNDLFGDDRKIISGNGPYAEAVARAIKPGLSTKPWTRKAEDDILNAAFELVKKDTGSTKRAQGIFRDDDFLSDILSYYNELEDGRAYSSVTEEESDDELFGANDDRQTAADIAQCVEWMIDRIQADDFEVEDPQESLAELEKLKMAFEYGTLKTGLQALDNITDMNVLQQLDVDMFDHFDHSLGDIEARVLGIDESADDDMFGGPTRTTNRAASGIERAQAHLNYGPAVADALMSYYTQHKGNIPGYPESFVAQIPKLAQLYADDKIEAARELKSKLGPINYLFDKIISKADIKDPRLLDLFSELGLDESEESDDDMFGHSNVIDQIKRLLAAKQKVVSKMMGAMGIIFDVTDNGSLGLKPLNKPYSKMRYSFGPFGPDKLKDFYLVNNQEAGRWELHSREQQARIAAW